MVTRLEIDSITDRYNNAESIETKLEAIAIGVTELEPYMDIETLISLLPAGKENIHVILGLQNQILTVQHLKLILNAEHLHAQ